MRKLKQTFILLVLVLSITTLFSSCEKLFGYDFTKQEGVDNIKAKIAEHIPADALVSKIRFMGDDVNSFSTKMVIVTVNYYEPNSSELKQTLIYTTQDNVQDRTKYLISFDKKLMPEDAIKLSDIDMSKVAGNIARAVEMIKEEDYPFSGIEDYVIIPKGNNENTIHEFHIQSRSGSDTKIKGGKTVTETQYYKIPFVADGKGNLTISEK